MLTIIVSPTCDEDRVLVEHEQGGKEGESYHVHGRHDVVLISPGLLLVH